ncbi:MAG: phenylalanine--tRNA ligase subunit alpha [Candidatus Borkfalkiaceae bacterium]|nr:phenylalanine--tRNA ligase subunit alpha [Christensenellaceae bacterium]
MKEKIKQLYENAVAEIRKVDSAKSLDDERVSLLGKNGAVTGLLKGMRDVAPEDRPKIGQLVNDLRTRIESFLAEREQEIKSRELNKKLASESYDVTMPGKTQSFGAIHPINLVRREIIEAFSGMGFEIFEGPEIELDEYNFQLLNIPKDHPSRDMQDTFYITDNILLRTQTSSGQARVMLNKKPPLKILSPGKVYRSDDDATHSPMFHQMEGLVVDENVNLCDLKGALEAFLKKLFDADVKTRFRPSYFPFTEPSVEVDVSCFECHGKGCRLCKGTGWIEILGGGMVNRNVFKNCGFDADKYRGFAFGIGLERIAMLKYGIPDIRYFFDNDVRFLKQFK